MILDTGWTKLDIRLRISTGWSKVDGATIVDPNIVDLPREIS